VLTADDPRGLPLGQVTIFSSNGTILYWEGAQSTGGEANANGSSAFPGTHILGLDHFASAGSINVEVSGGGAIRIHNVDLAPQSGEITLTW
jgi:hypothetical protein